MAEPQELPDIEWLFKNPPNPSHPLVKVQLGILKSPTVIKIILKSVSGLTDYYNFNILSLCMYANP